MSLISARVAAIESDLLSQYGAVISGADLRLILGFKTGSAFRQAAHRGALPVRTFFQTGRRGRSASSAAVAAWMAALEWDESAEKTRRAQPILLTRVRSDLAPTPRRKP